MNIWEKLKACPCMTDLSYNTLSHTGTGLFPQGISSCTFDVTGSSTVERTYLLRHRDRPDSNWIGEATQWLLEQGFAVRGGKLTAPTGDGFGTWELEFKINGGTYEN